MKRHPSLEDRFDSAGRIVEYDPEWPVRAARELRHLAVRDFLRAHQSEASRYVALKREVVARYPQDRLGYMAGKEGYMADLEARALAWAQGRS